jgi:two-component system cell cycle response regulator DivK
LIESGSPQASRTIIIVEDNALVAKFFRMALERAGGFSCLVSEDVPLILQEVRLGRVDLVLLDISLSHAEWQGQPMDGVALCRLLKSQSSRPLPVVLVTAHAMAGDRERLLKDSGADAYLEKPVFEAQVLVNTVRSLLPAGATESN